MISADNPYLSQKEYFEKLYVEEKKSSWEIAKLLDISQNSVMCILKAHNIPRRSYKENKMPVPKGSNLSEAHKQALSKSHIGKIVLNPETGRGYNFSQIEVECGFCKTKIFKKKCHTEQHKVFFCNHKCHAGYKKGKPSLHYARKSVACTECGETLIRKRCEINKNKNGRFFCDQICAGIWKCKNLTGDKVYNYRGGYEKWENYGPSWPWARKQALERDNHTCQNCGKTKQDLGKEPDVHHKIPFRFFGLERHEKANRLSNLVCYCPKCHKDIEERDLPMIENYAKIVRGIHLPKV